MIQSQFVFDSVSFCWKCTLKLFGMKCMAYTYRLTRLCGKKYWAIEVYCWQNSMYYMKHLVSRNNSDYYVVRIPMYDDWLLFVLTVRNVSALSHYIHRSRKNKTYCKHVRKISVVKKIHGWIGFKINIHNN